MDDLLVKEIYLALHAECFADGVETGRICRNVELVGMAERMAANMRDRGYTITATDDGK
jgi:hypothetical protein